MRIAIVTDAWTPQVNGVVRTLSTTKTNLEREGHKVFVIHPGQFSTFPCPTYAEIQLALRPKRRMQMLLENLKPEAIHIATEGPLGWAARNYCVSHQVPFTTSYHTRFPEYIKTRFSIPLSMTYSALRRFHHFSNQVLAPTPAICKDLQLRGFQNVKVWTRGVDTEIFKPRASVLDLPRPILMNVGRVAKEKNLEAFLDLKCEGSKVVVGDGPQLNELKRKYSDVHFLGAKFGDELASLYASADVFVFPSCTDTFGLVMLEALACGTPVAAFPVAGPIDVITNPTIGALDEDLNIAVAKALRLSRSDCRQHAVNSSWRASTQQFFQALAKIPREIKEVAPSRVALAARPVFHLS